MLDEESEKRIALEEKFQKRVRNRLKEQRLEIEGENEENLAKILQAHKNEIEALSGKIAANKNAKVRHSTVVYALSKNFSIRNNFSSKVTLKILSKFSLC